MSPHAVGGTGTRHTVETVERGRERAGRGTAWAMSCHTTKKTCQKMSPVRTPRYDPRARGIPTHAHMCQHPLTTRGTQALYVVDSVKLHLTAYSSLEP